jgi:hypothetical protein
MVHFLLFTTSHVPVLRIASAATCRHAVIKVGHIAANPLSKKIIFAKLSTFYDTQSNFVNVKQYCGSALVFMRIRIRIPVRL